MPATEFIALRDEIAAKSSQLFAITSTAGADLDMEKVLAAGLVPGAKTTQDVVDDIKRRNAELNALDARFAPYREAQAAVTNAEEHNRLFNQAIVTPPMPKGGESRDGSGVTKSVGQLFIDSPEFKAFKSGQARDFAVDLQVDPMAAVFLTTAGFAPESTRSGRLEYLPMRPIAVIDHIPQIPITAAADVFMEETTATEAAAERAEGAAAAEEEYVWTQRTQTVRSIDASLPVTEEQLEDVPGMAGILDNRMILSVQRKLDVQVLAGDGVAPRLLGTENVVGIQTQAKGVDNLADAFYKLFRQIRDAGFAEPEVGFVRAAKWQDWRLAKTNDGIYINGSPSDAAPARLWGVPILETNATTAAKGIAGAYRAFSALRTRTGFRVELGHVDTDFKKRQKTILAGVRVAMVHYRPSAFGQVTGL